MKTERLYDSDSYLQEFSATVLSCEEAECGYTITLDRTAFFPESGGQGSDTGFLDEASVFHVTIKNEIIYHNTDKPLTAGRTVKGRILWQERFEKMQNHTGEHIVSGVIHHLFGYDNVGFHLGNHGMTADFNGPLTAENIVSIEEEANRAVFADHPITAWYPQREEAETIEYRSKGEVDGDLRLVRIGTVDCCACCAPHVKTSGQVGLIKITAFERYKGGVRMSIACGAAALRDYAAKQVQIERISALLSAMQSDVADVTETLLNENKTLKHDLSKERQERLMDSIQAIESREDAIIFESTVAESDTLRLLADTLADRTSSVAFVYAKRGEETVFALVSRTEDLTEFSSRLRKDFQARCGGKEHYILGTAPMKPADMIALVNRFMK